MDPVFQDNLRDALRKWMFSDYERDDFAMFKSFSFCEAEKRRNGTLYCLVGK